MQNYDVVILGAGPTGLATALGLNRSGTVVLEREDAVGGLCRSFVLSDAVFDIGGHSFHTEDVNIRSFVCNELGVDMFWQERDARVLFGGCAIPYPFQTHFHLLPDKHIVQDCQRGLSARQKAVSSRNLEEFLIAKHGEGIARHFLLPYNRKLWQTDLRQIDCTWASERVAPAANESVPPDTPNARIKPLVAGSMVGYPREGGFGELFRRMSGGLHVACGQTVNSIDLDRRSITIGLNREIRWKVLVSTIPLPEFVSMIRHVPPSIVHAVDGLEYVSLQVDFFVVNSRLCDAPQRLYSADADFPPHKVAFNSRSCDHEATKKCHSIICETSIQRGGVHCSPRITNTTVDGLLAASVIGSPEVIVECQSLIVKYAYPIQTHGVTSTVAIISEFLRQQGVYTAGRFGQWQYINSDQCIAKGFQLSKLVKEQLAAIRTS